MNTHIYINSIANISLISMHNSSSTTSRNSIALIKQRLHVIPYTLNYFNKLYGTTNTLKGARYFFYRKLKEMNIDLQKEHIIKINDYMLNTIPNDTGISSELLSFRTHEPLSTKLLNNTIQEGMTCLDIGANIGYYALLEKQLVGSKGKVIAVEPSPKNFKYLKKNAELNTNNFCNLEIFNFALSATDGFASFLINDRSNLCKIVENTSKGQPGVIDVPKKSIDSFISEENIKRVDFLRMDVEGHEKEIISGAKLTIQKHKPMLYVETHKALMGIEKTIDFLKQLQFLGYDSKYYIARELDLPYIGTVKDIKSMTLDNIIENIQGLPDCFHLLLTNKPVENICQETVSPFFIAVPFENAYC
jgi:FkbM family methyltransferase